MRRGKERVCNRIEKYLAEYANKNWTSIGKKESRRKPKKHKNERRKEYKKRFTVMGMRERSLLYTI